MRGILVYVFVGFALTLAGCLGFSRVDESAETLTLKTSDETWSNEYQVSNLGELKLNFQCPRDSTKCTTIVNNLPRGDPTFDPLWGSTYLTANANSADETSFDTTSLKILDIKKPDLNSLRFGQPMLRVVIVKLAYVLQLAAIIAGVGAVTCITGNEVEKTQRWLTLWGSTAVSVAVMHLIYALACANYLRKHMSLIKHLLNYKIGVIEDEAEIEFADLETFTPLLLGEKTLARLVWALLWVLATCAVALAYRKASKNRSTRDRNYTEATSILNDDEVAQTLLAA